MAEKKISQGRDVKTKVVNLLFYYSKVFKKKKLEDWNKIVL